jgi:hypothetical protein
MSSLVSDVIVRSTHATRGYQSKTRELIIELNSLKEEYSLYKNTSDGKIKNLNS